MEKSTEVVYKYVEQHPNDDNFNEEIEQRWRII